LTRQAHRRSRQAIFDQIHILREAGTSIDDIARQTGFGRRSIRKWLKFTVPPERRATAPKPCSPNYFIDYLSRRWAEGCVRGRELLHEIKLRGYTGSFSHLERLLAKWRRASGAKVVTLSPVPEPKIAPPLTTMAASCAVDPATGWAISPIVAASLCIKPRGLLTLRQAAKVDALKSASADFTAMRWLAMRFRGLLRSKDIQKFGVWLDDAQLGNLRNAALRPYAAARSRRRHKRVDRGVEQRSNRRAHQSTEDPQARDVRSRRRRTPTRPDVGTSLAD